ncbi:MAG: DUF4249 domain-containing protein [Chitinophaga sp.]|jgi:hypothetical protein|nr:DUF4249 domain-containing protein [Chitinophaga sp.]PJE47452.1 MAG: DUF4249 domain-containing protein [Sediminibacterium sp.] [Sediminibacterium sp. FEMGT703S]
MRQIPFILLMLFLLACEKDIQIEPLQNEPKLVVDAEIENGQAPMVVLSNSLNYFSTIDTATLFASFIKDAKVQLNNGTRTVTLQANELRFPQGGRYVFYTTPLNDRMLGETGKTYQLTIDHNGKQYQSTTTIPLITKTIDSLWSKRVTNRPSTDSFRVLMARIFDPPGLGNYIRYFTKVNNQPFLPGFNSAFDDAIIDGKTYNIDIDKGVDRNQPFERENYGFFKLGDTVTVRLANIDKATYDFWRTWEFAFQSIGNPFSSPGVVKGNISNGALGAFCGYGSQYKTYICKD